MNFRRCKVIQIGGASATTPHSARFAWVPDGDAYIGSIQKLEYPIKDSPHSLVADFVVIDVDSLKVDGATLPYVMEPMP